MKISISKTKLIDLNNILQELQKITYNKSFSYLINRNINKIKPEVDVIYSITKPSEKLLDYEKKRLKICESYCERNEDGSPKMENNVFVFSKENKEKVLELLSLLFKDNEKIIEEHNKQQNEIDEILKEEIEIEIYPISFNLFPNTISSKQIDILLPIIKEKEEELVELINK